MRTSRALAPIRSAAASAIVPTVIEWLCVPGARRTSSWSSGWVMSPSSSRLMPVTIPNAFSTNGRLPPRKKPAIRPQPARQRLSLRDQAERLVLPEAGGPGQDEVAERGGGADLDQLGPGPDLVERQHARRGPPHQDQEVADARPQRQAGQQAEAEGDHQGEVGVVGDRQDHRGDRDGDQLGVPGLHGQEPDEADRGDDQAAERGDPAEVAGDLGLVAVDVVADQGEQRGDQDDDRAGPPEPGAEAELRRWPSRAPAGAG